MVSSKPFPIEVALADGTVLRGLEHPADGPPLLFMHDLGDDLDAWGSVAAQVNSAGFRVIRLELRGHGLSDGEPDPPATMDDLTGALAEVTGAFGPAGLVAYGAVTRAAFSLGTGHGAPVHALISPTPPSGDGDADGGILHRGDDDADGGILHRGDDDADGGILHRGDDDADGGILHRGDDDADGGILHRGDDDADGGILHRGDDDADGGILHRGDDDADGGILHRGDDDADGGILHRGDDDVDGGILHRGDDDADGGILHRGDDDADGGILHRGDDDADGGILHRGDDDAEAVAAMRVLFTGAHDELTHGYVHTIHSGLRGQNMWISTGTVLRGPTLLREHPHLVEQLVMFMRRHLTAHHLAWIAEHGSQRQDSEE